MLFSTPPLPTASHTAANTCMFSGATMLASTSQGGGLGGYVANVYQVVVKAKGILYFAKRWEERGVYPTLADSISCLLFENKI